MADDHQTSLNHWVVEADSLRREMHDLRGEVADLHARHTVLLTWLAVAGFALALLIGTVIVLAIIPGGQL